MMIHYVTSNKTKFQEACLTLQETEQDRALFQIALHPLHLDEIQGSVQAIARHKALEAFSKLKKPVLIDDVSIHCPALGGLPGPYMRSFLEALGKDGFYKLISNYDNMHCFATCMIAYMDKDEQEPKLFEGTRKVQIVPPKGNLTEHGDVSWNSIVIVEGQTKTCAEFTLEELSRISPRRAALEKCKAYLYEKKRAS